MYGNVRNMVKTVKEFPKSLIEKSNHFPSYEN